jgi:NAD(P)H dehydrogenase (quinone)
MKVLNIIAHPDKKSFNFAIHNTVKDWCNDNKIQYKFIDLYLDKFNPVISTSESTYSKELINEYRRRIAWADVIIITSPVWWFRLTTQLEGFFDKVMTPGFAYKFKQITKTIGYPQPLLKNKRVITFLTHGAPALPVKTVYANSVKLRLLLGVYSFCFGWFHSKIYQFWSVPYVSDAKRKSYLEKVKSVLRSNVK